MHSSSIATILLLSFVAGPVRSQVIDFKQFERNYDILHQDLLNHQGEVASVKDFTYSRDVATFVFHHGDMHFQRYVNGRPTTAIFIGSGTAQIGVPSHVERQSLLTIAKDSVVNDTFSTCFIRFADDLDLRIKEKCEVRSEKLDWSAFNKGSKLSQGEFFFKPIIDHLYDNYFQLLRSVYERRKDGYFWVNFNRFVFNFDPNRAEQARVSYQFEGSDIVAAAGALLQRQEIGVYDDSRISQVTYESIPVRKSGRFDLGGTAGLKIESGEGHIYLVVNADSLRFLSLFLDNNLKTDSISCNGNPVDYHRRKDFMFVGIILPEYAHRGDTLDLALWYKGFNYDYAFPFTENPRAVPHAFSLICPNDFNLLLSDSCVSREPEGKRQRSTFESARPYSRYSIYGYAAGFDTIPLASASGIHLNFIEPTRGLGTSMKEHRDVTLAACDFASALLGPPMHPSDNFVCFGGPSGSMPGVLNVPVTRYSEYEGGLHASTGEAVFRQWFVAPASSSGYREQWLFGALAEYVNLMFIQERVGSEAFYTNLLARRNALYTISERGRDLPLAVGTRALPTTSVNKGVWVLHMLRWLMYDLETGTDDSFRAFLKEMSGAVIGPDFTNADFVALAEKHFGGSLAPFFHYWLYGTGLPEFDVEYGIEHAGAEYFVNVDVANKTADESFRMPVIFRIVTPDQVTFARQLIRGRADHFRIGPFASSPTEVYFNEFFSVLSKDKVSRK